MPKLTEDEVRDHAALLGKGWERLGDMLVRTWQFSSPQRAVDFVNRLAEIASRRDHFPDITLSYREVHVELTTHAEGGLTQADFDTAREFDLIPTDR